MKISKNKGSITVEASIILPIFISAVLTIAFLIKLVYIHEVIQHAINETAGQMASYSYFYHISGVQGIQDAARNGLKSKSQLFQEHAGTIIDTYEYLHSAPSLIKGDIAKAGEALEKGDLDKARNAVSDSNEILEETKGNLKSTADVLKEASKNPVQELKSLACIFAEGAFEDVKTEVCIPVVSFYIKKYLKADNNRSVDENIKSFNIINGFEGLDFSESSFFEDENDNIDIIVKYKVEIPVPFKAFPSLSMVQRATVKAWLGGNDADNLEGLKTSDSEDIWSLNNFQRGNKLRSIFGANLPSTFPVISSFDSITGRAMMIKSMDLTADSYQNKAELEKTINDYIKKLVKFDGQEKPWGEKGIIIRKSEIKTRELVLVIPKNPVKPEIKRAIDEYIINAASRGITLKVEEYGMKKLDQNTDLKDNEKTELQN